MSDTPVEFEYTESDFMDDNLDHSEVRIVDAGADLVTVKVWEWPVRVTHWVIFAAVIVLMVTGFYVGSPYYQSGSEPGFIMGKMRFVHFVAAWAFIAAVVSRLIWAFIGNHWANWRQFIPVEKHRRYWARETFKFYVFARKEPPPAVGHNPLAGFTYSIVYAMFGVQIITGLALLSLNSQSGLKWFVSGWVFNIASLQVVRLVHHLIMWTTAGFIIHHVFSAVLVDLEERTGVLSSIVTGFKRVPRSRL